MYTVKYDNERCDNNRSRPSWCDTSITIHETINVVYWKTYFNNHVFGMTATAGCHNDKDEVSTWLSMIMRRNVTLAMIGNDCQWTRFASRLRGARESVLQQHCSSSSCERGQGGPPYLCSQLFFCPLGLTDVNGPLVVAATRAGHVYQSLTNILGSCGTFIALPFIKIV